MAMVDAARIVAEEFAMTADPPNQLELARLDREDYLESVCAGINAYRKALK